MLLYCRMYAALAMLFLWPRSRTHLPRSCSFRGGPCSRPPENCCRVGVSAPAGGNFLPTLKRQKQQFHMHRWCDLFCGFTYMSYMITCENTLDKTTRTRAANICSRFSDRLEARGGPGGIVHFRFLPGGFAPLSTRESGHREIKRAYAPTVCARGSMTLRCAKAASNRKSPFLIDIPPLSWDNTN